MLRVLNKNKDDKQLKRYSFVSNLLDKDQEIPMTQLQKTAKVVFIKKAEGARKTVGILKVSFCLIFNGFSF